MDRIEPPTVVVPENRYDLIEGRPDLWNPTVAVVVPVFNHAGRLVRVLEGLARQSRPADEIIVADDGSDDDICSIVDSFPELTVVYTRQDHDGFGAGRARNMGARSTGCDVVLFIDGDCIPGERLVEHHLGWHRKTANLVVVGGRYHVDEAAIGDDPDDDHLAAIAMNVPDDGAPDDWRRVFYSRNRWLRTGSDAFRAFVSSNVSVTKRSFDAVGGFSESFRHWGGEDTELGWRLWNAGATFAVAPSAVVFHQTAAEEDRADRERSRRLQKVAVANVIPHRFYRPVGASIYTVPKCSWIVELAGDGDVSATVDRFARSLYPDVELIVVGSPDAVAPLVPLEGNEKVNVISDGCVDDAVRLARGEFIVIADDRMDVDPRFLRRAVKLMERNDRLGIVWGPYRQSDGSMVTSVDDLESADGGAGAPPLSVLRRRELMKDITASGAIRWQRLFERTGEALAFEPSDFSRVEPVVEDPGRLRIRDLRATGWRQVPRVAAERLRRRTMGD